MLHLSEEQQLIKDSASRFVDEQCPFGKRQQIAQSQSGFDAEGWKAFAELGWLGISIPESLHGFGGSLVDVALIVQQHGRTLLRSPYLHCIGSAAQAFVLDNDLEKSKGYLQKISMGEGIITTAFHESENPTATIQTSATHSDGRLTINGCKRLVPWGAQADHIIVSAVVDNSVSLIVIPTHTNGVKLRNYRMYDDSRASDIELSDVVVDSSYLLNGLEEEQVQQLIDMETALLCMEASEIMWAVHDQTLEYLKTREQFGQTLSSMQALQHRIVDVYVKCQLAQSLAEDAMVAVNDDYNPSVSRRVSAAKSFIGQNGRLVGKEGIQLHGGIGMTDDIPIGHYLKRLTAIDLLNGNSAWHRQRFYQLDE